MATITIQPTCTFTNALPFPATVTVLEAWYDKQVNSQRLNAAPSHTNKPTFASKVKHASVMADAWSMGLPQDDHLVRDLMGPSSPIHAHVRALQCLWVFHCACQREVVHIPAFHTHCHYS